MLTAKDINKLIEYLKEVFVTKEEFHAGMQNMDEKFSKLQTSVDNIAKSFSDNHQEVKVFGHRVDGLENWAKPAGGKIGLEFIV